MPRDPQKLIGLGLMGWLLATVIGLGAYYACVRLPEIQQQRLMQEATKRWKSLESFEKTRWKVEGVDGDYESGAKATIAYVYAVDDRQRQEEAFGEKHPWPSAGQLVRDDLIRIQRRKNLPLKSFAPESMGGLPREELLVGKWIPPTDEIPKARTIQMTR